MIMFSFFLGAAAGGAAIWYGKDKMTMLFTGTADFINALEAKAKALKAKL